MTKYQKYASSPKGKANQKRKNQSKKGKIRQKKYCLTEKGKLRQQKLNQSEKGKLRQQKFWSSPKGKILTQIRHSKRRALKNNSVGYHTITQWVDLLNSYNKLC